MTLIYNNGRNPALPRYYFPHYGGMDLMVCLAFDEKAWTYYRVDDDSWKPAYGCTNTCHVIDHSKVLMNWAVKRCFLRLAKILRTEHLGPDGCIQFFESELDRIIKTAKETHREEFEEAGELGSQAHDFIEKVIKSIITGDTARTDELLAKMPEDERAANACVAALTWMSENNVQWISSERKVYSLEHNVAGTLDALAVVNGKLSIVDWKTSNYLYLEFLLQTALYQHAYEEETGEKIEDRWVIRLGKEDAEFDPWHVERKDFEEDWKGFYNALQLVKSVESIQGRIDGVVEKRKAAMAEIDAAAKAAQDAIACPKSTGYKGLRLSKCLPSGEQCAACRAKYEEMHQKA
jgi:hypothetical protein